MLSRFLKVIDQLDLWTINLSNAIKLLLIFVVSTAFFGILLKLNIMTPMWSDDYMYSFVFTTTDRIQSFSDLVHSQYIHYMKWGGRTVGHIIVQTLLLMDPLWADITNAFGYILLVIAIYLHAKGTCKKHNVSLFLLINLFLWFFAPYYGETILWITGSGNYMWCTLIILLFLLPYRLYNNSKLSFINNALSSLGIFLLGILAGWTNENVGIATILMALVWLIFYKEQKFNIPIWAILGIVGAIIGYSLLVLAPGNYERLISAGASEKTYNLFFVYFKFNMYTARLVDSVGFLLLVSFILMILVLKFTQIDKRNFLGVLFIYSLGIIIPVYAMIPSPTFPIRAMFGTVVFAIIFIGSILYKINYNLYFVRLIRLGIVGLFSISFIFNFYGSYKDVKYMNALWTARDEYLKENIKNNVESINLQGLSMPYSKYVLFDASFCSESMSNYYNSNIQIDQY